MTSKMQGSLTTTTTFKVGGPTTTMTTSARPTGAVVIRDGSVAMRKRRTFGGATWKPRRLELDSHTLTVINPVNNKRTRIELRDVTELERTDLADHSLCLKASSRGISGRGSNQQRKRKTQQIVYHFSFSSDPELYDWQDDIYQRSPLGNVYSAPFDFVHKSHIGSDNVTGTFTDPNILPIYAEIVSGQPAVSKTATGGIVVTPRSRPTSTPIVLPLNAKPIQKVSPSSSGSPMLEGTYVVKHNRFFASWIWRDRWLSVTNQSLVVHQSDFKNSPASKNIPLVNLTRIEPDEKREGCLVVEYSSSLPQQKPRTTSSSPPLPSSSSKQTPPPPPSPSAPPPPRPHAHAANDTLWILFKSYDELYTWRDALYDRSAQSAPIGNPTGFVHNTHVGYDPDKGMLTGLPTEWQTQPQTLTSTATPTTPPLSVSVPSNRPSTLTRSPSSPGKLRRTRSSKRKSPPQPLPPPPAPPPA